jgi:dTDP-4-amino-4,6-dideoxygalactose transaminase
MTAKHDNVPAIEGGEPVRKDFLPFFRPSIDANDIRNVTKTLESGWLTLGPQTQQFEEELQDYLDVRHVVAMNSCSAAMFVALKALGVGPGDEVVTSPLTFASTVHAIMHTGAKPVLADIEMETFGPAPEELVKKTTKRTKAYMPVHFGGQACLIDTIADIAKADGVHVVEDAAHGFGAATGGRMIGGIGDATAFSFYATKNLTSGEGGCLTTNSEQLARQFRMLSYHGMSFGSWDRHEGGSWFYDVGQAGYKFNMSDLLSSLGLSQLSRIDELLDRRRVVAETFIERLGGSEHFELPRVAPGNRHTWHLFVVLLNLDTLTIDRDRFVEALAAENIGCSVHFIPVYKHRFYRPYVERKVRFPQCESYFSRCLSLPIFPDMSDADIDDVVRAMNRIAVHYSST